MNTYIIEGERISAVSYAQAKFAYNILTKVRARKRSKLDQDAKLARTQYHAK